MPAIAATSPGARAAHHAVRAYIERSGIDPAALRADGRLHLDFDGRHRVQLRPAAQGGLAITSLLLDLGLLPPQQVEDTLMRIVSLAAGMLREHAAGVVLDASGQRLLLQQVLPADTDVLRLESELAAFINVLPFWRQACDQEAGRRQA